MYEENDLNLDEYYDDAEMALDRQESSELFGKSIRNFADIIMSQHQLENKGRLLGHYKSKGFLKTYLDVYERAILGQVEKGMTIKRVSIREGYACLTEAVVEGNTLYLLMNDEKHYRIRHLRKAEMLAYLINTQKAKTMKGE